MALELLITVVLDPPHPKGLIEASGGVCHQDVGLRVLEEVEAQIALAGMLALVEELGHLPTTSVGVIDPFLG